MISRRTMRAPQIDRIILRSNFTLSLECENPPDHFIAKLAVSRCLAIHDRRSMWSAFNPGLFRPGLLVRPSTPLNNPSSHLLLSTALLHSGVSPVESDFHLHLFLVRLPSPFSPSSSNIMPSSHDKTGAASSAPSDRGSLSRSARPISSRNSSRLFGGSQSLSAVPPPAQESEDPLGTLGAPTARASLLEGGHFAGWARRSRCNLGYSMLEVLNDDAWDVWRISQVTSGLKGTQRALVRICQGAYQIPRRMRSDRAFVRDPAAAGFVAVASAFLFRDGDAVPMSPNPFVDWGQRLPNYFATASAANSRLRAGNSFEWAMISDGGVVVTDEDWEVNKGLSSIPAIEAMYIPALPERGFHLKPHDCFPVAPFFLHGVSGVPSSSTFPPLWSLRFFASRIYGRGGTDGSHPASAAEKRRFDIMVRAELVMCITLGVAAEREANQRTQILPVGLINLLLGYNRGNEVPTHRGTLSVRTTGERLMRERSADPGRHEIERPLHVSSLLYYIPDAVLDAAVPATAAASPVRSAPIPCGPPFADPGAPIRAMEVDSRRRTPVVTRRLLPALALRSVAPPRSPSYAVPQPPVRPPATVGVRPPTQVPAPAVPSGRPSRSGAPRRSAFPLSDLITTHVDLAEFRGAYPYLLVLDRFGDQRTARLRGVLDCVSGWVRAADPCSVKAHQRGSRGGTAAELRRARDELSQAEAGRRSLRRELDAIVGRVAQLTEQLCEYSGRGKLEKRRRDDYARPRDDDYDRSRGRDVYGPARGHAERQEVRYGDRYRDGREESDEGPYEGASYCVRKIRDDRDWDGCRGPTPWRRDGAGGDGGAGFAA